MWDIEFFEKDNGRIPVQEFLDGLSQKKDLPYIDNALQQLSELGHMLQRPQADYLRDDIYELRIKTINGNFRLLYFFFVGNRIIITHGFKKKTARVSPNQIDFAIACKKIFLQRKEK